jgi:hypothetical protein
MPAPTDALALKRLLSPLLLAIEGVSGLGVPGGQLTIYLEADDADVRRRVSEIVARAAPGATPRFEVTGPFRKQ